MAKTYMPLLVEKVPLVASDSAGGVFAWQNHHSESVIVTRVVIDLTTKSSGAGTLDVGMTATSAATSADNLIDGLDVNAATGVFDNVENQGTNGTGAQKVASGKWVTASKATGNMAGIVGSCYLHYHLL
jgi:hypothetical protein